MPLVDDNVGIRDILVQTRVIAVAGLSTLPQRPSYFVAQYLQQHGYRIIPVNPNHRSVLGETCYPQLKDVPEAVDMVACFRNHDALPALARDAVAIRTRTLWMQLGLWHDEAARIAAAAGLDVVMNRCLKIEHAALVAAGVTAPGELTGSERPATHDGRNGMNDA